LVVVMGKKRDIDWAAEMDGYEEKTMVEMRVL
jgi:hypothetical protein